MLVVFFANIFFSCTETPGNKKIAQVILPPVTPQKPPSSSKDTLTINTVSAVFYNPDDIQLERIRSVNKKEVFESLQHEYFYQMRNARIVLKKYWPHISIIETSNARWLAFLKADNSKIYIDLDGKNDMSGIILFDKKKDPLLIDMMNIDTALELYFTQ